MTWLIESSTGASWLSGPTRPIVPMTPVIASSSGIPAATIAPNAISRMSSVIGSDVVPAFWRSELKIAMNSSSELPSPDCSMRRSGCAV